MKDRRIEITGILLIAISVFVLISLVGYSPYEEPQISPNVTIQNPLGIMGVYIAHYLIKILFLKCSFFVTNMWFAHFTIPMVVYYSLFPHLNAYSLLIGAFFANIDAIIVKLNLKKSEFHLNSFFHSIPFGLLSSLIFLPFGTKDMISFIIGHIIQQAI